MKKGFTIIELVVSMGIFILIFTIMVQLTIAIQGILRDIDEKREFSLFVQGITETLGADSDEMLLQVHNNGHTSVAFRSATGNKTVRYSVGQSPNSGEVVLSRTSQDGTSAATTTHTFTHPKFFLSNIAFLILPDSTALGQGGCTIPPAFAVHFTVGVKKPTHGESTSLPIQTTFTSPEYPHAFKARCLDNPASL